MSRVAIVFILCAFSGAFGYVFPPQVQDQESGGFGGRIVGGSPIDLASVHYQVSVLRSGYAYCGGTIVSKMHIVTAAHCIDHHDIFTDYIVRVGSANRSSGGTVHQVALITSHPLYDPATHDYDVAVLKLTVEITNPAAAPIALAPLNVELLELILNQSLFVSGWGLLAEGDTTGPEVLYGVTVKSIARTMCNAASSYNGAVTPRMICAAAPGKDSCAGDSGGPLAKKGLLGTRLYGIVSWGKGCAQADYPGVYTNVAHPEIRNFITSNMV